MVDLAKKFNCSSQSVKYKLDKLFDLGLTKAYRVYLDLSKLGLHHYGIGIFLKNHKNRNAIIEYIKNFPSLEYYHWGIGYCDLQLEFILESFEKLTQIAYDVNQKFPGDIRKMEYWIIEKYHKERWLPELY